MGGRWVPTEVRPSLCGAKGWWAALPRDRSPTGTLSSPIPVATMASPPLGVSGPGVMLLPSQAWELQEPT